MIQVNRHFGLMNWFREVKPNNTDKPQIRTAAVDPDEGFDTVSISGNNKSWQDIANEWKEYTDSIWGKPEPEFNSREEREEYWISYYDKYIEYCDKVLACDDLPEAERSEWSRMKNNATIDRNNHYRDLNNWKKDNGIKTESFEDVYAEMRANVPDRTSTIAEKQLAISYIERMLSCNDITNAGYWQRKLDTIEKELAAMQNKDEVPAENEQTPFQRFINRVKKFFNNIGSKIRSWLGLSTEPNADPNGAVRENVHSGHNRPAVR